MGKFLGSAGKEGMIIKILSILGASLVINLTGLKITLPLCLLLHYSWFLHKSMPCEHSNKLDAWAVDNLAPHDVPFLSIIA